MSNKSLVSVIIPCYNYAQFLEEAVVSVIDQIYTNWECLIIDDGSTDDTKIVAAKLTKKDPRIKYYYHENQGLSVTRNRGFALTKGDYIQFLDADDMIHPQKLKEQVEVLDNDLSIGVSHTNYQTYRENLSNLTGRQSYLTLGDNPLEDFLYKWEKGLSIPIHAALFRRSLFKKIGQPFNDQLKAKEDWVLWIELALRGVKFSLLNKDYCFYRKHNTNQTADINEMCSYFIRAVFIILKMIPAKYHEEFIKSSLNHFEMTYLNTFVSATLFYDKGNGFNDAEILSIAFKAQQKANFFATYCLKEVGIIKQLRFDPLEGHWCKIKLSSIKYINISGEVHGLPLSTVTSNGIHTKNGYTLFRTFDPIYYLPISGEIQQVEITGEWELLGNNQIEQVIQEKEQVIQEKEQVIQEKEQEIVIVLERYKGVKKLIKELMKQLFIQ